MKPEDTQVVKDETQVTEVVAERAVTSLDPILRLVQAGTSIEQVKELVQLYREERAYQAEEAYNRAFARFQESLTPIPHDATASFSTKSGAPVKYTYSTLHQIATHVNPHLHSNGFSYSWEQVVENGTMIVTCTVRHEGGASRKATFVCPIDGTTLRSKAQDTKAALTFAQRCSLISALGLTTAEDDRDGAGLGDQSGETISEKDALRLAALCAETGTDSERFRAIFGIDTFDDLPASQFKVALNLLEKKRGKK